MSNVAETIQAPKNPGHYSRIKRIIKAIDPTHFDKTNVNSALKALSFFKSSFK